MLPQTRRRHLRPHRCAWGLVAAAACTLAPVASAQFYEKVDFGTATTTMLRESISGDQIGTGAFVAGLSGLGDPTLEPLFRAMVQSDRPGARIYGVLGAALTTKKGIDPALMVLLTNPDERAAVIREANVSGILRDSPVDLLLAQGNYSMAATLTLVGELNRRGATWDPAQLVAISTDGDPIAAGVASLLLLSKGESAAWDTFKARLTAMPEQPRSEVLRALTEGALVFEISKACEPLLALTAAPGISDEAAIAAIGAALRLDTTRGVEAWKARVAQRRSQAQLVRAGLQLLASQEKGVPAATFDALRNGNVVVETLADTGKSLAEGGDAAAALIALLDVGHPMSAEWALVRASDLPPQEGARVWKHLMARMDDQDPAARPTGALVAGVARELMKSDPEAVRALAAKVKGKPALEIAVLSGIYDSRRPEGVDIVQGMLGQLPRAGESIAILLLARAGAPLNPQEMEILGRAGAGGGDLDPVRQSQAAWLFIKRQSRSTDEAVARVLGKPAAAPASSERTP